MKISVKYGKATVDVTVPEDATLGMFKAELEKLTSVPRTLQKLTGKPNLKDDDRLLKDLGIKDGTKLMLVGSSAQEVVGVATGNNAAADDKGEATSNAHKAQSKQNHLGSFGVPLWMLPPFAAVLADPYSESKIEGGTAAIAAIMTDVVLSRVNTLGVNVSVAQHLHEATVEPFTHPLLTLTHDNRLQLVKAHSVLHKCREFCERAASVQNPKDLVALIAEAVASVEALSPMGEWLLIPAGWIGTTSRATLYLLIRRLSEAEYTVVVVNASREAGEFHPSAPTQEKVKCLPCVELPSVSRERLLDRAWWAFSLSLWVKANDPQHITEYARGEVVYDVLLQWLVEAPVSTAAGDRTRLLADVLMCPFTSEEGPRQQEPPSVDHMVAQLFAGAPVTTTFCCSATSP